MRTIAGICSAHSVRCILVTQATMYRPDLPEREAALLWFTLWDASGKDVRLPIDFLAKEIEQYNTVTRRVAVENGLPLYDSAVAIPKDVHHFYDDCHFNVQGARVFAENLAPVVRDALFAH